MAASWASGPRSCRRARRTLKRGLIDRGGRSIGSQVVGGKVAEMNVVSADTLEASLRTLRSANDRKLRDEVVLARLIYCLELRGTGMGEMVEIEWI